MKTITLSIYRPDVYKEVAQTTGYTGYKMNGDPNAYDRIQTTDDDAPQLQRFWDESRTELVQAFKRLVQADTFAADTYTLTLSLSEAYDPTLTPSMQLSLFSYFVQSIISKWFVFTNKDDTKPYAERAVLLLEDALRKALYKRNPKIPSYYQR